MSHSRKYKVVKGVTASGKARIFIVEDEICYTSLSFKQQEIQTMDKNAKFVGVGIAAMALVFSTFSLTAMAGQPGPETVVFVNPEVNGNLKSPARPYTREEILNARPVEWTPPAISDIAKQRDSAPAEEPWVTEGPVITIPPGPPDPNADIEARRVFPDQWALLKPAPKATTRSDREAPTGFQENEYAPVDINRSISIDAKDHPYTIYRGNYWDSQHLEFPWKAIGKLLFKDGKIIYAGSAQVIRSPNGNLIVTAAHNVWNYKTKAPYTDFTFIPAERDGVKPYGEFKYERVRVLSRWKEGDYPTREDVALIVLKNNSHGKPVSYYTGWLGMKMNLPYTLNLTAIGYSVGGGSEGKWTTISTGQTFFASTKDCPDPERSGVDTLFMGSNLTSGASGGAWLYQYKPFESTDGNYVVSVVSGGTACGTAPRPLEDILLGPRFSDNNIGGLCMYEGCRPDEP